MARLFPFNGLRYNQNIISDLFDVVSPPYDVISDDERISLYQKSEYNITRIDYGISIDEDSKSFNNYTRAKKDFNRWIDEQILVSDGKPVFYIYEQTFSLKHSPQSYKGIISLVQLEDFANGIILPHEGTDCNVVKDRLEILKATNANISPVCSLFIDENKEIEDILNENSDRTPDATFSTSDGRTQNLWVISDDEIIANLQEKFENKQLFLADGHHRYEAALKYRDIKRMENPDFTGDEPFNCVMMMMISMSDNGLWIVPTHRLVRFTEFDEFYLIGLLTDNFNVSKIYFTDGDYADIITDRISDTIEEKRIALYTGEDYYYLLKLKDIHCMDNLMNGHSDVYKHLDVTLLHALILEKFLGIEPGIPSKSQNLAYTRSSHEAVAMVKSGDFQCSFLLNPTKISEIKEVSLCGEKMSQNSSYFWPKLVTGIVINKLT